MHLHEIGLDRAIEDQRLPQLFRGVARRIAVLEFEVPETGLDGLGAEPPVVGRCSRFCESLIVMP